MGGDLCTPQQGSPPLVPTSLCSEMLPLAVQIPTTVTARTDSFINDLIWIFLNTRDNQAGDPHVVPLAIHVTSRPHMGDTEPIKR
jgi:hypothetical protein